MHDPGQIVAASTDRPTVVSNYYVENVSSSDSTAAAISALKEEIGALQAQMNALCLNNCRQSRPRWRSRIVTAQDPEINRDQMDYASTMRNFGNTREGAIYHVAGIRETEVVVRKRGQRWRLDIPLNFRIRQGHARFISARYRRRH